MMYTQADVEKHQSKDSLWVAHKGKVYDVTAFSNKHPGGLELLLKNAGQDVEDVMKSKQSHRHSAVAYSILQKYYVGDLVDGDGQENGDLRKRSQANGSAKSSGEEDMKYHGWEEDTLVDWSKPLVWQVGHLGKNYMEWVHSPVDKQIRFFGTEFIENLCISPWWLVPLVWVPVMLCFVYWSYQRFLLGGEVWMPWLFGGIPITKELMPVLFVGGAMSWTFLEYCIHRYFFHLPPPPNSRILITLHFLIHGQHHKSPMDRNRLVFPPVPASFFAAIFYNVYMCFFPPATGFIVLAGLTLGYMIYDLMHYYLHHGGQPVLNYLKDLKRYHIKHHFVSQQLGFGISTKFWDYPFGTLIPDD